MHAQVFFFFYPILPKKKKKKKKNSLNHSPTHTLTLSPSPAIAYDLGSYAALCADFVDTVLGAESRFDWVGTSMGGLIAMVACAPGGPLHGRVTRLLLNDIAPEVSPAAIARIQTYTKSKRVFASVSEARAFFRQVYAQFGSLDDDEWTELAVHSLMRTPEGTWTQHYDQAVFDAFSSGAVDPAWLRMWECFDALEMPVMVLHGVQSDLLTDEIVDKMRAREQRVGPLEIVEIQGCGHTPMLNNPTQWTHIERFLGLLG
jgi:pimeloyl-ACP methyl ester carboxylesterase